MPPPPSPAHRRGPRVVRGPRHALLPPIAAANAATTPTTALAALLLAALATTLPLAALAQTAPAPNTAVIVGAGISGLAAADALCARGFKVTVLEGRSRAGGRTFTTKLPITGAQVEIGAGWIHDAVSPRNSVAKFVADPSVALATQTDDDEQYAWTIPDAPPTAGKIVADRKFTGWEDTAGDFEDLIGTAEDNWAANQSLQKYFNDWVAREGLSGEDLAAVRTIIQSGNADLEYGATLARISAKFADEGEQGEGPEKVITKGYGAVVDALLARIRAQPSCGANAVVLNAKVTEIKTVASPAAQRGVYVKLSTGVAYSGKFGVTTLPLGVLKQGGVKFVPALTTEKQNAVSKLGMGLLNKIVLVYDRPFFNQPGAGGAETPAQASWFSPITSPANSRPPADGDAYEWWNHARFWPGSNAVVMLIGADTASKWEALNPTLPLADRDRALAARADALFRQLFPSSGAGAAVLKESFVTRWASDPFSYGSYSYLPVGATPGMRNKMCAAQSNLLWWAGEACSASFPSTTNGAMDTGVAAAKAAMVVFRPPLAAGRR